MTYHIVSVVSYLVERAIIGITRRNKKKNETMKEIDRTENTSNTHHKTSSINLQCNSMGSVARGCRVENELKDDQCYATVKITTGLDE